MIKTKNQYKSVKHLLQKYESALEICGKGAWTNKVKEKAITDNIKSQIIILKNEIRVYKNNLKGDLHGR